MTTRIHLFEQIESVYFDTQANIEALTGVIAGAIAYATDRSAYEHFGTYNGASWEWDTVSAAGVATVTGDGVDNTDPVNPVMSYPTPADIGAELAGAAATAETNAKNYADGLVVGLWDDRGSHDASGGAYPSSGGSGTAGVILKGDVWTISVAGTLPTGQVVEVGDLVRALIDTPGNTQANWAITQNNIGYTAENSANKATTMTGNETSNILYLTAKAIYDWATGLFVQKNTAISGATKTKITYDSKGLVTAGADATQDDIGDGTTYKQYSATEKTKLAGIEAGADVTDEGNVGSAIDGAASAVIGDTDKLPFIKSGVLKWELWVNITSTLISLMSTFFRTTQSANATYYVRTDGSDSNTGLVDSSGGAFLTVQHAIDVIKSYDWGGYFVTIQIGAGTFSETVSINGLQFVGLGGLTITGTLTQLDSLTNGVGAVQGSGATQGTVVRNSGSWTLNQRQNKICRFTSGVNNGLSRIIDSNIAGATATIVGGWASGAPANGDTFVIEDWGTIIRGISVSNNFSLTLNNLKLGDGSSAVSGLSIAQKVSVSANRCWINQTPNTSINGLLITSYCNGSITDSYLDGGVTVSGDFVIQMQASRISYTRCKIFNPSKTKGRGIWSNGQCGGFITGCVIDGGIIGLYVTGATPYTLLSSIVNHVIRNCATGVQADSQSSVTGTANVTYSGNTADESATAASYGYID